jgi:hypothetical protein
MNSNNENLASLDTFRWIYANDEKLVIFDTVSCAYAYIIKQFFINLPSGILVCTEKE